MRTISRMIIAGAISFPLALAAGGVASADTDSSRSFGVGAQYSEYTSTAGPEGASTHVVHASTGYYHDDDDDDDHDWNHHGWHHGWHHHGWHHHHHHHHG
jgi:hypothetical protein